MEKNQLRKHLKFTLKNRIRSLIQRKRLAHLGTNVFIDRNVRILRYPKNITIQNNVVIKEGTRICSCNEHSKLEIGENTTIGYHNFIFCSERIKIGSNCLIAPFVYIVDSNHQIKKGILINQQENITAPIEIGNDVWIASNVTILKGVKIGDGAVIASGAVVNQNVESNSIYGGIPAKKIGERSI